jgi:hypothetical protein
MGKQENYVWGDAFLSKKRRHANTSRIQGEATNVDASAPLKRYFSPLDWLRSKY